MKLAKHRETKAGSLAPVSTAGAPFWPLRRLQSELDRFFEDPFSSWLSPVEPLYEAWMPAVNVYEEKDQLVVKAELPGMKKEELEVFMSGDTLNIAGERKFANEEKTGTLHRSEQYFGRFHRSIRLPSSVKADKLAAHYKDGILTITCPKTEEAKRKAVAIKVE
jgi:HSP20 family protein